MLWKAADGIALNRDGIQRSATTVAAADQAECRGREVTRLVPEGARVYVVNAETASLSALYSVFVVDYAFRRATLVTSPADADLILAVVVTPQENCGGLNVTATAGGRV